MSDFFNKYPYTDCHELNLDWVIKIVKKLTEDWAATLEEWNSTEEQWQQLYDYVHDYFDNLDVQQEINNKINAMIADGTFVTITTPVIEAKVASMTPGIVSANLPGVVASQIGGAVADQIDASVAAQIDTPAATATAAWLSEHITQPTVPAIDNTLTVLGAGADAKATGDAIAPIYSSSATYSFDDLVLYNGVVYRCIEDIETPEAFNSIRWEATSIGADLAIFKKSITEYVLHSTNVVDPASVLQFKGINADGTIVDTSNTALSGLIKVSEGDYLFAGLNNDLVQFHRIARYDSHGTFIERVSPGYPPQYYQVPAGTGYIRAQLTAWSLDDRMYVGIFNDPDAVPVPDNYSASYMIKRSALPDSDSGIYEGLQGVAFGTSLTARAYEDHKYDYATHGYLTYLRQHSGAVIDNQGIGGADIYSDGVKSIYTAITSYTGYADKNFCIIEGFINDWSRERPLGTYLDTGLTTVCGRLRNAINYIYNQNADLTVFVILDHYGRAYADENFSSIATENNLTIYQYFNEIEKLCEAMGIICIKEYALSEISERTPQYLADYVHLNDLGAQQSGACIWNVMKQFTPNVI